MAIHLVIPWMKDIFRKPGLWFIIALLVIISIPHYRESLEHPTFLIDAMSNLGLERHAFERILYLAPIVWAGFLFGWRGSFYTSLAALAIMLPRALVISEFEVDSLFEMSAVFILGNVLSISFHALRRERENRSQLETAHRELQSRMSTIEKNEKHLAALNQEQQKITAELKASEERYRELFENANDAIWLHDLEDNIITTNKAWVTLTGYDRNESHSLRAGEFLSEDCFALAKSLERDLLRGKVAGQLIEGKINGKAGKEAYVQISTSPIYSGGNITGFQHIARDVTEQKRMQENLTYHLHQVTRAQEEERRRISRELHDDTIQALVVLSRRIDALASRGTSLSEEDRFSLEELIRQTDAVMQGVRRLSQDLRPAALDRLGLLSGLEWLAADISSYSGLKSKVSVIGEERRLPEEVNVVLFRIVQEGLRNIWRHSGATEAEITITFEEKTTKIRLKDNGKGFILPSKLGDLAREGKLGLAGMTERAKLIGGSFHIMSEPGKGTTITMEYPG